MKDTIEDLASQLAGDPSLVKAKIPKGYHLQVFLLDKNKRRKKKNASADNWSPAAGEKILIEFCPGEPEAKPQVTPRPAAAGESLVSDPLQDIVRALDRAESKQGCDFIALKWFRDTFLPGEGFDWTSSDSARNSVLRNAIEKRLILTSKVPNPKSPQFPVTAVRLNRLFPETRAILGTPSQDGEFQPIDVRGESLSKTVLRERR